MPKKCPPGVICIENISLFILVAIFGIIAYLIYKSYNPASVSLLSTRHYGVNTHPGTESQGQNASIAGSFISMFNQPTQYPSTPFIDDSIQSRYGTLMKPMDGYTANPHDVLLNPYTPPVNMSNQMLPAGGSAPSHPYVPPGRMPVNVSTNGGHRQTSYTQVGIMTPSSGQEKILPLMGRQLHTSRQKWQYYTMSDNNNSVKLPIVKNGRSCTNEYGCDEIYGGDTVYVEGYNQPFTVTVYDNDGLQYIPYI